MKLRFSQRQYEKDKKIVMNCPKHDTDLTQSSSANNNKILSSDDKFEEKQINQIKPLKKLTNANIKQQLGIKKLQKFLKQKRYQEILMENQKQIQSKETKIPMFFKKQTKYQLEQESSQKIRINLQSLSIENKQNILNFKRNLDKIFIKQQKQAITNKQNLTQEKFSFLSKKFMRTQKIISAINTSTLDLGKTQTNQTNRRGKKRSQRNCSIIVSNNFSKILDKHVPDMNTDLNGNSLSVQNNDRFIMSSFFIPKTSQFKRMKQQLANFKEENDENPIALTMQKSSELQQASSKSFVPSFIKKRQQKNQLLKKSTFRTQKSSKTIKLRQKKWNLNDFQIKQRLGKGAFGDVYLAKENQLGFFCVLKKLSKKKIKQEKLQEQIIRQIKVQSFLDHPHLTKMYGFFDDEQFIYLVLEYLTEGNLAQRLKHKKYPQKKASSYIKQICEGLKLMHIEQIIHRDLKPQNIFVDGDFVKIGDFGCSIRSNSKRNTLVGCLAYISPEQLNSEAYDDKIDMWSLGVLCYELLTGYPPFEDDIVKIAKKQKQALFSELTFPSDIQISSEAEQFTRILLSLKPENRMSAIQSLKHPFLIKNTQHHKQNLLLNQSNQQTNKNKDSQYAQEIRNSRILEE